MECNGATANLPPPRTNFQSFVAMSSRWQPFSGTAAAAAATAYTNFRQSQISFLARRELETLITFRLSSIDGRRAFTVARLLYSVRPFQIALHTFFSFILRAAASCIFPLKFASCTLAMDYVFNGTATIVQRS